MPPERAPSKRARLERRTIPAFPINGILLPIPLSILLAAIRGALGRPPGAGLAVPPAPVLPFIDQPFPSRSRSNRESACNLALATLAVALFWWGLDLLTARSTRARSSRSNAIAPTGLTAVVVATAIVTAWRCS